jgi:cellulose synthase/poly-beta-1,6-N-acetylglucosamine synthase-like glycosyltransferase
MEHIFLILGSLTFISGVVPLIFSFRFKKYVRDYFNTAIPEYTPSVSLILPCKGIDPGFRENVKAMLNQDYPDYEIVFVVATQDDPAYPVLEGFVNDNSFKIQRKLIVAGISPIRGQKINNLIEAINNVRADTEVFAFVDSDNRPGKDFLRNLVKPLQFDQIGATTGIRWYLPKRAGLGSMLRSVWAAGAYPLLIDQKYNFTYGGANALKRETFEKANIRNLFDRAVNDSFAITNGIKNIGLKIFFVPKCIVVSHEDSKLSETVEFTNRQTITTRVYSPSFWWTVFLTYCFSNVMLLMGITLFTLWIIGKGAFFLPALLMLSLIPLEIINAAILLPDIQRLIPEYSNEIEKLKWRYYLTTPLASILILFNSVVSLCTNEFTWRGVRYRLVSPTYTEVLADNMDKNN